ncbi:MAG: glutamyl-tRNA reductase [Nitrospirae bacterium]|nr:glutamyl-tRNA reductase [Candidatus Troglogloeales bacterium]MBI3598645.1 glutamyl-tRNA reductase [Candidatus Troglogloeales bacterium]
MNIILAGLNHRTAKVEIREQFALSEEQIGEALYKLKRNPLIQEALILSTCNRVELYAVVTNTEEGCTALKNFFLHQSPSDAVASALYTYSARDCLRHLFRVSSSLDSMILGEPQILGQLKDAFDLAMLHKSTGVLLNKVCKKAISVAKRVRTETKISENAVSISYAAVELAKKIFGKLHQKSVMLVGAGEMAELSARHFISNGVKSIFIANRSYERSLELASEYQGIPVRFEDFFVEMAQSDIVLCSTGAPHYLIGPQDVSKVIASRANRPIFFIDISVPRNIDPAINQLDNVFLYDIDDLKLSVEANLRSREVEAFKAEEIITEEVEQMTRWFKSLDAIPMIVALKEMAEEIRIREMKRTLDRLGALTPEQREAIDGLTLSIVNKLLHGPLTTLKEETHGNNGNALLEATQKLFQFGKTVTTIPTPALPLKGMESNE